MKQKFPFSKFAVLAELAIADTQFARGNYTEAVDSYKAFIRLHPTHEKVEDGYAAFKVGECYFKDMPDDIWLLPPSYEKDQSAVTDALRELDDFRRKFPDSKYQKDAEPLRKEVLKRLVDHEVYVARFYLNRDHTKAAAHAPGGRDPALPGLGTRARAAVRARPDLPADGRPARDPRTPSRAWSASSRPRRRRAAPSFTWSSSRSGSATTRSRVRRPSGPPPPPPRRRARPMDDRLREVLNRGREHYVAREYDEAERYLAELAREQLAYADVYDMLGVIYHQQGRLLDAEAHVQGGAAHQPGLHRGGAQPGGHATTISASIARPRRSTSAR